MGSEDADLMEALLERDPILDSIEALLERDPSVLHQSSVYDRLSALHIAAANGQIEHQPENSSVAQNHYDTIEQVEAAMTVLKSVNSEEQLKLDEISKQQKPPDVPKELFHVLQDVKRNKVMLQSHEEKREALYVIDLDKLYLPFDDLIQRASFLVFGDTTHDQKKLDLGSISERKTVLDLGSLGSSKSGRKSSVFDLGSKSERKTMVMISDESLIKRNRDEGAEQEVSKGLVHTSSLKDGSSSVRDLEFV